MINNVSIKNFKSLKDVSFESRRVNVFIGEPNVGKSNLLEALGVFSISGNNYNEILRYNTFSDLFSDSQDYHPAIIELGKYKAEILLQNNELTISATNTDEDAKPDVFEQNKKEIISIFSNGSRGMPDGR